MATRVTVIGFDGSPLSPAAEKALATATLIAGGRRHLAALAPPSPGDPRAHHDAAAPHLPVEPGNSGGHRDAAARQPARAIGRPGGAGPAIQVEMGPVKAAIGAIAGHDGEVAVIASGDPGFFGIVRALREAGLDPLVLPAVSSVSMAFARAGIPWDDAIVVSAHGRDLRRAVNICRAHPKVAVLTAPDSGPAELQTALDGWPRKLIVAENLGMPEERISQDTTSAKDPNVVLVLDTERAPSPKPSWIAGFAPRETGWARPESMYVHRASMITKAEVRAVILAKLRPQLGDLIWDIGTGSGSVAIECAHFGAAVIAVDRDVTEVSQNALGGGIRVVAGEAPGCLAELPDPDAIFAGGGGLTTLAACTSRRPVRVVLALTAVDRVGPALSLLDKAGYRAEGVQLQANRLSPLPDGSYRLAATNPVFVISGELA